MSATHRPLHKRADLTGRVARDHRFVESQPRRNLPSGFIAIFILIASTTNSSGGDPTLSSDQPIVFDFESQSLSAKGNATIEFEELHAIADKIQYFKAEGRAIAEGNVRLNFQSLRLLSPRLLYEVDSRQFSCEEFRAGFAPFYAEGKKTKGRPGEIEFEEATLYWQEPNPVSPNIKAKRFRIMPNRRIIAERVLIRVGKLPLFYLPRYSQRADESGLKIEGEVGFRGNLGAFLRSETLFPASSQWSLGATFDAYTERGILAGPTFGWGPFDATRRTIGDLRIAFINDSGPLGYDINGEPIENDRYFLNLHHLQSIGERVALTAEINLWSDSEITRDFRPEMFRHIQQPDNFVEALHFGKNSILSFFTRFHGNDFFVNRERVPEVRFDLVPSPFFRTRFLHRLAASYARLKDDSLRLSGPDFKTESDHLDFHYSIYRPLRINDWLNLLPKFGTRTTHYFDTLSTNRGFTRVLGEIGVDAEIKAYATWEVQNEMWNIDGLRHIVRPIVRYRYLPGGASGTEEIIPIDREVFNPSVPAIDLANIRSIDDLTDLNVIRLGVENLLQTRAAEYGSRNLAELHLYQDYHFNPRNDAANWSDFYTRLNLSPIQWLNFDLFNRFQFENLISIETRTQLSLNDGDIWRLVFASNNLRNEIDQYEVDFLLKFNERWMFRTRLRLDARKDEFTERVFALRQRVAGIWEVEYQVVFHEGSGRENDTSFNIRASLLTF